MKKVLLSLVFAASIGLASAQTFHTITSNTNNMFSPDSISVQIGDTVIFDNLGGNHPTLQVNAVDWFGNQIVTQGVGFNFPSGNGTVPIDSGANGTILYYVCQNHLSSDTMKGRIFVQDTTMSIGEVNVDFAELKVYPNPVTDFLHLELQADGGVLQAEIVDAAGRQVRKVELTASGNAYAPIRVSGLKAGSYILKVSQGNTSQEISFIKR